MKPKQIRLDDSHADRQLWCWYKWLMLPKTDAKLFHATLHVYNMVMPSFYDCLFYWSVCVCVNSFWFEWYVLLPAYYFFRLLHGTLGNILFIYICWSIDFFELIANNKQQSCPTRHIIFIFDLVCCGGFYSCNLTKGMNENWTCWMSWSEYGTCLCPRCKQISCFVEMDFFLFDSSVCTRWHWF